MARPQSPDQQQLHHDHIVSSAWTQHLSGAVTSAVEVVIWPNHASPWSSMQNSDKETKSKSLSYFQRSTGAGRGGGGARTGRVWLHWWLLLSWRARGILPSSLQVSKWWILSCDMKGLKGGLKKTRKRKFKGSIKAIFQLWQVLGVYRGCGRAENMRQWFGLHWHRRGEHQSVTLLKIVLILNWNSTLIFAMPTMGAEWNNFLVRQGISRLITLQSNNNGCYRSALLLLIWVIMVIPVMIICHHGESCVA